MVPSRLAWHEVLDGRRSRHAISFREGPSQFESEVRDRLERGPGFVLIRDVPTQGISPSEAARLAPEMVAFLGEPRAQGPADSRTFGWLVRDEGTTRFQADGSFTAGVYTSKSPDELELHNDSAMSELGDEIDYFALLCMSAAAEGGQSILVSVPRVMESLEQEFPREMARLRKPFAFERRHVGNDGRDYLWAPVFDQRPDGLRVRCNRQRIEMAPALTRIALTSEDKAALDALDEVMARPDVQYSCMLSAGDLLVVNDHRIVHARSAFRDDPQTRQVRCLVRVLLNSDRSKSA